MESKIIENGIILLHKYNVEQTVVIYSQITRTFGRIEHLHFPNIFSYFFRSYKQYHEF